MNDMFSQGGKGSTGILTNKQAVARHFGVKQSEVIYFSVGVDLGGYKVIYNKETQRAYSLPAGITAGTIAISLSTAAVLVHSKGSVDLGALAVLREEFVTLTESFASGFTIRVKNELVSDGQSLYRWDGVLPKTVDAGGSVSSDGVSKGKWVETSTSNLSYFPKPITWAGFAGGADPTGLAASDAVFAAANSSGSSVFFPAGTYRIAGNSSLADCEVWFEMGASISVDSGATLTIGRIKSGTYKIFDGAGVVNFTNQTVDVYPEWFGAARGIDSTPFITKCLAACSANKNTVRLTNVYLINDLLWDSRVPVISDRRAAFTPTSTAVNGVTVTTGNAGGMCSFPTISGFSGFGFKLLGTDLANIKIVEIRACTDALVLETSGTDTNLLDNEIQLTAISVCTNGVVFVADKNSNVMQGNRVYCNFITSVKNSVLFRGNGLAAPGPNWDSNKVVTQAIDPTASLDAAAMLRNENTYAINRFVFRVETWAGGLPSNGKYIDGIFNGLDAYFNLASTPRAGQINYRGVSNKVDLQSTMGLNTTGIECSTTPGNLAGFNGGKPLFENVVKLKYAPTSDWANNTQRVAYLYHMLTDAFTNTIYPMPGENGSLRGVVFDQIVDNSNTTPYEIRVHLRNVSGTTIPAGTAVEFKLRIGLF